MFTFHILVNVGMTSSIYAMLFPLPVTTMVSVPDNMLMVAL